MSRRLPVCSRGPDGDAQSTGQAGCLCYIRLCCRGGCVNRGVGSAARLAVALCEGGSTADNAHVTWFVPKGLRCGQRTLQHQSIKHAYCLRARRKGHYADTNPPAQPFAGTAEYLCEGAVDYSCCFTKFPFGSTSNRDSLPFALTNTS